MEDQQIVKKFKQAKTKKEGFNLLVGQYSQRIYWHVRKMVLDHDDTDDLVQEIFIKVWKNLDGFREDAKLFTWLYRIATNECLTFLAKKKRNQILSIEGMADQMYDRLQSDPLVSGDEIELKLQRALLTLPDKQKMVFNMKYFEEMKYEQIAEITETSVGALKASYHHAVKKIESFLTTD